MEAKAIIMAIIGFFLLFGGLAFSIGIAWYHNKISIKNNGKNN